MSVQQPELGEVTGAVARPNWCEWKSRQIYMQILKLCIIIFSFDITVDVFFV